MPGYLQIALVLILVILLFGRGKISDLMGDVAKGISSFKKGLKDMDSESEEPKVIEQSAETPVEATKDKEKAG